MISLGVIDNVDNYDVICWGVTMNHDNPVYIK
jgi:hypothetical protein